MNILLDANILLRLADPTSATHSNAAIAVSTLRAQGESLHIVPQCVYEFWVVATRPVTSNGLGLSVAECMREVAMVKATFNLLDDKPTLFAEWEAIASVFACQGKVAHDARYVAAMQTHGLDPNDLQESLKAPLRRLGILALENSREQFAQHRSTSAKDCSLTIELLYPVANHRNAANGVAEMVRIEKIPCHVGNPMSRRVWALAWRRCSSMANCIFSSSANGLSAHNRSINPAQASMFTGAVSAFATSRAVPSSHSAGTGSRGTIAPCFKMAFNIMVPSRGGIGRGIAAPQKRR
jgi:hypothetical protein